jgi:hypothetical protein
MSLKFKRNLPTIFLLVGILFFLAIGLGEQRVVAYRLSTESLLAEVATLSTAIETTAVLDNVSATFTAQLKILADVFETVFQPGKMAYLSQ